MAQKKSDTSEYDALKKALETGALKNLYIFCGEEHYLLTNFLTRVRSVLISEGTSDFNYRRFEGRGLTVREMRDAVEALPAFSERTLVEVHDFDIFKCGEDVRRELLSLFNDLPEYVCLLFVYDTLEYSPDKRLKDTKELLKNASVVEFPLQEQSKLTRWIQSHFKEEGKKISAADAEYLSFITGGLMYALSNEIGKVGAYARGDTITRADIDAVVTPVPDAVSFKFANAVADGKFGEALGILDELLQMREPAHKIFFYVSLAMRQLLAARICIESGSGARALMDICRIRYDTIFRPQTSWPARKK